MSAWTGFKETKSTLEMPSQSSTWKLTRMRLTQRYVRRLTDSVDQSINLYHFDSRCNCLIDLSLITASLKLRSDLRYRASPLYFCSHTARSLLPPF